MPFPHHLRGHVVADQGDRDAAALQLPGREPGALEQRPGLVGEDAERDALLVGGEDDRQGRAVIGRGQAAGVAVGQDALAGLDQLRAVAADRPAHRPVLVVDPAGLVEQPLQQLRPAGCQPGRDRNGVHAVQRPEQVHRGRPAGAEGCGRRAERIADRLGVIDPSRPRPDHGPVGRRDPDRRRTADPQRPDRLPDRGHVPAVDLDGLGRQSRLVDQADQTRRRVADPSDRLDLIFGHRLLCHW